MEAELIEEEQIDEINVATDRLLYKKRELLFNAILYSKQPDGLDNISCLFYYNLKKSKIETVAIRFSSTHSREKFDSVIKKLVDQRQKKRKMFAFVNPSSGVGKGVEIFKNSVETYLTDAGIDVEHQITEKYGENSLGEIVKRLDLESYDALVVVGGDSSLRDIVNGIWEKEGKPDPKSLRFPSFVMIPVGTGNGLAFKWNGSYKVDSGVAAVLLGKTADIQMVRLKSQDNSFDKLGVCCAAYGWSIDALLRMESTNVKGKRKYLYGMLYSAFYHSEPFRVELELTFTDQSETLKLEATLRDFMLMLVDFSTGNARLKSGSGTLALTKGNIGKLNFIYNSVKLAGKLYNARDKPLPFGTSEEGSVQLFVGNVKKIVLQIPDEGNGRVLKNKINLDGDIYDCIPNVEIEFLEESLPVFYNDTSC